MPTATATGDNDVLPPDFTDPTLTGELPAGPAVLPPVMLTSDDVDRVVTDLLRLSEDLVLDLAKAGILDRDDAFPRVDMSARVMAIAAFILRRQTQPA